MQTSPESQLIRFGNFEVDLRARELRKDGVRVRLQDQPFQVLALLLQSAGNVVTRDELRDRLWPSSVYVDFDHGLNNAIARLRETMGDTAATPRFIETLPRVGYRFIFPITTPALATYTDPLEPSTRAPVEPTASVGHLGRRVAGAVAAAAVALGIGITLWISRSPSEASPSRTRTSEASIAVLPFVSMSSEPENEYFADGLSEELTQKLAGIRGLKVMGRTSAFYFKGRQESPTVIAKTLGVNYLLEGSVRRADKRVRITAQLVEGRDGYHLWSQTFDRNLTDIFEIQEDIARAVAGAMQIKLASSEAQRLRRRGTEHAEAYRLYVIGMAHLKGLTVKRDLEHAKALFELALARDPKFAAAHAGISQYHFKRAYAGLTDMERGAQLGIAAADRAFALDPESSEALEAQANFQAWLYRFRGDYAAFVQSQDHFQRAIELDPSNSLAYFDYGRANLWSQPDVAKRLFERAIEIDPLARGARTLGAIVLGMRGEPEAGRAECDEHRNLNDGDRQLCKTTLAVLAQYFGNLDDAILLLRTQPRRDEFGPSIGLWSMYLALGDRTAAREALDFGASDLSRTLAGAAALVMDGHQAEAYALLDRSRAKYEFSRILDLPTARLALIAGKPAQALAILESRLPDLVTGVEPISTRNVMPALDLAAAWSRTGNHEAARRMVLRVGAFLDDASGLKLPLVDFIRARRHALAGSPDLALQALDRAYDAGFRTTWAVDLSPQAWLYIDPIVEDPCLSSLRSDPRFSRWLARVEADNARQLARLRARDMAQAKR